MSGEEETKRLLVAPVATDVLGYDVSDIEGDVFGRFGVFSPSGGVPGFVLPVACESRETSLTSDHADRLRGCFGSTKPVRFAALTNGATWWFFTDMDVPNSMDAEPFVVFNFMNHETADTDALRSFEKTSFDYMRCVNVAFHRKLRKRLEKRGDEGTFAPVSGTDAAFRRESGNQRVHGREIGFVSGRARGRPSRGVESETSVCREIRVRPPTNRSFRLDHDPRPDREFQASA